MLHRSITSEPLAVRNLVECQAKLNPHAVAILGPGCGAISYEHLLAQIDETSKELLSLGICNQDCVALVLPNGPQAALAFLAVAAAANCAPLNPRLQVGEFAALLSDLQAKAIIVESGMDSAAAGAANDLGIQIIEISPPLLPHAGVFTSERREHVEPVGRVSIDPADVALTLHTSGTTSKPKLVPLTHLNLCTSARNTVASLELTAADSCLNMMPMFHIHALMAILSSIAAGASVVCASSADPREFYECMEQYRPSWYTASPAIHQAILGQVMGHRETIRRCPLRFIRSSSSALSEKVFRELEETFQTAVIECYAMTEASYQITANPLPPGKRKIGSVGIAAGPELAIMDDSGNLLAPNRSGEVVIRGANVMGGYAKNSAANADSFQNGWFRTGDVGFLDDEGYLFLTGRSKEIINKGGEKISPREVEEVLLHHPAVIEAAVFAIFHPALGEDVAAAIVLKEPNSATEAEIIDFVFERLAQFKAPQRVKFVERLPKNAAGKVQRTQLAAQLGLPAQASMAQEWSAPAYVAPRAEDERLLAGIWAITLNVVLVGVCDNFFDLGGFSLLGVQLCGQISQVFGTQVNLRFLYQAPTIERQAKLLRDIQTSILSSTKSLIPLRSQGSATPFFWVHGEHSNALLPRYLSPDQPLYGFEHQSHDGKPARYTEVETIAAHYLDELLTVQKRGPYFLGGYSFGGLIAFEMAQQLIRKNSEVDLLVILDSQWPDNGSINPPNTPITENRFEGLAPVSNSFVRAKVRTCLRFLHNKIVRPVLDAKGKISNISKRIVCDVCVRIGLSIPISLRSFYILSIYNRARKNYLPKVYPGSAIYFESAERSGRHSPLWANLMSDGMDVFEVFGDHLSLRQEPNIKVWAEKLNTILVHAQNRERSRKNAAAPDPSQQSTDSSEIGG